nr:uncharacterized protein LOC111425111 [Onthophagus taurus]
MKSDCTYRNPRSTNRDPFKSCLADNLTSVTATVRNCDQIEIPTEQLSVAIRSAYHSSSPLKVKSNNRSTPWWNESLSSERQEVRRLFNWAKTLGEWEKYKQALTNYTKNIRKAKRESWRRFCEVVKDTPSSARIHKILARDPALPLGQLKRPDGSFTDSSRATLELLMQTQVPGNLMIRVDNATAGYSCKAKRPSNTDWSMARKVVTCTSVDQAIQTFKPFKSPGEDNVFLALLQQGKSLLLPILVKIFRASVAWK